MAVMSNLFVLGSVLLHLFSLGRAQDQDGGTANGPSGSLHADSLLPDGSVRLSDGFHPHQGRVEVYYEGKWGTICDETWSPNAAIVLCRQLGYEGLTLARKSFGEGAGLILLDGLNCGGYEDRLVDCTIAGWAGPGTCNHAQDVGVVCSGGGNETTLPPTTNVDGSLRLADGTGPHNGRVEIYYQGVWGTICRDQTDNMTAVVVCRQLGYETADPPSVLPKEGFGPGSGVIHLGHVICEGNEAKVAFCSHDKWGENDCTHDNDAMVSCKSYEYTPPQDGDVRLVAGSNIESGQVEISYQGVWGTVCDLDWTIRDATVVCRQLGFQPARASLSFSPFRDDDETINPVFFDNVECTGKEARLEECVHTWRDGACDHSDDIGVVCGPPLDFTLLTKDDGRVRLEGGTYPHNGRVEIKYQGDWSTVCDQGWNNEAANVVCRQLGYLSSQSALPRAFFGRGKGVVQLNQVSCFGSESELVFCDHAKWGDNNCDHAQDASVVCTAQAPEGAIPDGSVRLVGGDSPYTGRLEMYYQGIWGTICGDNWSPINSEVVCQQLGYMSADPALTHYVAGSGGNAPIMLDEVRCSGKEERLVDCAHDGWAVTDCSHDRDIGIGCRNATTTTLISTTFISTTTTTTTTTKSGAPSNSSTDHKPTEKSPTNPEFSTIWVVIVIILIVPIIFLIFAIGLYVKQKYCPNSYEPVNHVALPMKERV